MSNCRNSRARVARVLAAPLAMVAGIMLAQPSQARADEITVRIKRVKAVDPGDALSRPDYLARITIAGESFVTKPILNQTDISPPDWVFRKTVRPGWHDVKVEILDKDLTKNDFVDINRVDGKRDLDFKVNSRRCQISGFSGGVRCGSDIVRAGAERKSAEVTFTVRSRR